MRHVKRLIMRVLLNKHGSRTKFYKYVNKKLSYRMNNCYIVINSGRGALFASSVSLTSPLRSEVPGKTKVATSISRSIPFHPAPSKPYVTGWNADASKSGRILRFFRRSTGREKPPRPYAGGQRTCRAGDG